MPQHHSTPIRGLMSTPRSPQFQGRFGRMFRSLPKATFGKNEAENVANLTLLGAQKVKTDSAMGAPFDAPFDGPDPEESGIPALYTYLGQFVDHDITFDPASSLQAKDDPAALTDFRSPAFDLDNIYGRGPDDQPYMYQKDGKKFLLGKTTAGSRFADLPRNNPTDPTDKDDPPRALIGDPRNDENTIVSQFQGLFHRFHNRMVDDNPTLSFDHIQRLVRFHYQHLLLNDFLPRIIRSDVLDSLKMNGHYEEKKLKFFHWKNGPFMPVEFSVAAYRLGHSMVRPGYRLNDNTLLPIFSTKESEDAGFDGDLRGFRPVPPEKAIDWGRFIDIDLRPYGTMDDDKDPNNKGRLQFAYRIDTSVVFPLSNLPSPSVVSGPPLALPVRNLIRGWHMELPNGQHVAHAMGVEPMKDDEILIGKGVDNPDPTEPPRVSIDKISPVFKNNCPLWTYVLAEAMRNQIPVTIPVKDPKPNPITTPQLGPVGGRIIAEVFIGLMFGDNHSLLRARPTWKPQHGPFALKDFVNYALGIGQPRTAQH